MARTIAPALRALARVTTFWRVSRHSGACYDIWARHDILARVILARVILVRVTTRACLLTPAIGKGACPLVANTRALLYLGSLWGDHIGSPLQLACGWLFANRAQSRCANRAVRSARRRTARCAIANTSPLCLCYILILVIHPVQLVDAFLPSLYNCLSCYSILCTIPFHILRTHAIHFLLQ